MNMCIHTPVCAPVCVCLPPPPPRALEAEHCHSLGPAYT